MRKFDWLPTYEPFENEQGLAFDAERYSLEEVIRISRKELAVLDKIPRENLKINIIYYRWVPNLSLEDREERGINDMGIVGGYTECKKEDHGAFKAWYVTLRRDG